MARHEFSHRSSHSATRGRRRLLFGTVLIFALVALDMASGGVVRNAVRGTGARAYAIVHSVTGGFTGAGVFSRNSTLAHQKIELERELAAVQQRAAAYQSLKEENDHLRTMLKLSEASVGIAAPIISAYHASPYGTFTVGAGIDDGIAQGDLVLSETGFVIGRITDAQASRSLAQSVFHAGAEVDVVINQAAVTADGEGGGNGRVSVPRGIDVLAGDTVIAPRFGGRPVGMVGKVEEITTTAEQRVHIVLPVNISLVRFVYIVPAP